MIFFRFFTEKKTRNTDVQGQIGFGISFQQEKAIRIANSLSCDLKKG